jgi:hypothetical protein
MLLSESFKNRLKKLAGILIEEVDKDIYFENNMKFWHGGNLNDYDENIAQKNGRYEYGAGLYLTTHYDTALKYSKGSRKLYLITVDKGNDINNSFLNLDDIKEFVLNNVIKNKQKEILERLEKYNQNNKIKAFIFNNVLLNEKALKPKNTINLREFLINNNIDYEIVDNPFGWGEKMMVLYNMKKIKDIKQITSKDEIEKYDLY